MFLLPSHFLTLVLPFQGNGSENHTTASDCMLDPISPPVAASTSMNDPSINGSIVIAFIDVAADGALVLAALDTDGRVSASVN